MRAKRTMMSPHPRARAPEEGAECGVAEVVAAEVVGNPNVSTYFVDRQSTAPLGEMLGEVRQVRGGDQRAHRVGAAVAMAAISVSAVWSPMSSSAKGHEIADVG